MGQRFGLQTEDCYLDLFPSMRNPKLTFRAWKKGMLIQYVYTIVSVPNITSAELIVMRKDFGDSRLTSMQSTLRG